MKRHITLEQLSSLSEFGRENLWRYFEPVFEKELGAMRPDEQKKMGNIMMGKVIPLLDIPTMIEYLGDKWVTYLLTETTLKGSKSRLFPPNENLCDALWEQVKELLED